MERFSLTDLVGRCREEREKFRKGLDNDSTVCLELFRRALERTEQSTDAAWQALVEAFTDQVRAWFYHHSSSPAALVCEEAAFYINGAFIRLHESNEKQPLVFSDLPKALFYLRRCLTTVILNEIRRCKPLVPPEAPLDPPLQDDTRQGDTREIWKRLEGELLWQLVLECIPDSRERRLLFLRFIEGYQPKYIQLAFVDEFPEIREIYRMLVNILARLKRGFQKKGYGWEDLDDLLS